MRTGRNTLVKFITFKENECEGVEKYLEEKALEGWFLEDISCGFFKFKKSEPKKCKFSVDIFTDFRTGEYIQYCESVGWNYVAETNKYLVFYSEDENITPIQTDEEIVLKKVTKSMIGNIFVYILISNTIIRSVYDTFFNNTYGNEVYGNYLLFLILISVVFVFLPIVDILKMTTWYIKTEKAIKSQEDVKYPSLKELKIKMNFFSLYISVFIVVLLCLFSLLTGLEEWTAYIFTTLVIILIIIHGIQFAKTMTD